MDGERFRSKSFDSSSRGPSLVTDSPTRKWKQRISPYRLTLRVAFLVTVLLQVTNAVILSINVGNHDEDVHSEWRNIMFCGFLQLAQLVVVGMGSWLVMKHVWVVDLTGAWELYLATILTFCGFYSLLYVSLDHAFAHSDSIEHYESRTGEQDGKVQMVAMMMVFLYFSTATQTLVGYGDIVPLHPATQVVASAQNVVGILYSVYILSQTLNRFGQDEAQVKHRKRQCWRRCTFDRSHSHTAVTHPILVCPTQLTSR